MGKGIQKKMKKILRNTLGEKPADIAIMILSAHEARNWGNRADDFFGILDIVRQYKHNLPIFWVITKLDQADTSEIAWNKGANEIWSAWAKRITDNMPAVSRDIKNVAQKKLPKLVSDNDHFHIVSVTEVGNIGIDELRNNINANAPLYAQIHAPCINQYIRLRRTLAIKIISLFASINFVVGALPAVDVIITPIVDYTMLKVLQHLRTHPERTADVYKKQFMIRLGVGLVVRTTFLIFTFVTELSVVFAVAGVVAGATVAAASTTALGAHAYDYFTEGSDMLEL